MDRQHPDWPPRDWAVGNEFDGDAAGPVVQAGTVHGGFHLHAEAPGGGLPVPAQLAPVTPWFTDRVDLLDRLDALVWQSGARLVVLCGLGGSGKTSAALAWLHRHRERWPDGQLSGDLGGRGDRRPAEARLLAGWLRALGVPAREVPAELAELAALWRTLTASRRLGVLLDGIASARQVPSLLPAGPGCVVVATSRKQLPGLIAGGARLVPVGPLPHPAAVTLLHTITATTPHASQCEEGALSTLARLCGQQPLALTACAARLAAHPHRSAAALVAQLRDRRRLLAPHELRENEESMTGVLDTTYAALSARAQHLYRGLGIHPGPEFGTDLAAAITTVEEAQRLLDELFEANLVTPGVRPERWRMHDLVAAHAHTQAHADPPAARELLEQVLVWYLEAAVAADLVINPNRWHLGPAFQRVAHAAMSSGEAVEWAEGELGNLVAAADAAHEHGMSDLAWQIAEALWGYLLYRRPYPEWVHVYKTGLRAALACEDPRAQARMHIVLGVADLDHGRVDAADEHFLLALELDQAEGHPLGEASAADHLGHVRLKQGRPGEAIIAYTYARGIHQHLGRPRGAALMLRFIGTAQLKAGRPEQAIATLADAVDETAALPKRDPYNLARTLTALAEAYLAAGAPRHARPLLEEALQVMTERGASYQRSVVHRGLAAITQTPDEKRHHLRAALDLLEELAHPDRDEVAALLEELSAAAPGGPQPHTPDPDSSPPDATPPPHGEHGG